MMDDIWYVNFVTQIGHGSATAYYRDRDVAAKVYDAAKAAQAQIDPNVRHAIAPFGVVTDFGVAFTVNLAGVTLIFSSAETDARMSKLAKDTQDAFAAQFGTGVRAIGR